MKNFTTFNNQNQPISLTIMKNLFFFFICSLASLSTFAQCGFKSDRSCPPIDAHFSRIIVDPNCDQGNCIGLSLPLDQLTRYMEARVIDLNGRTIVSYKMSAPKGGFNCNDKLPLKLNKFNGLAFLEVNQQFNDGTYNKYRKRIYIISNDETKKNSNFIIRR